MTSRPVQVAQWLRPGQKVVAFTGAGISTESGIPDFRSPGGVWATSQPVYFDQYVRDPLARYEYWRQKAIAHQDFVRSEPNVGHQTLAVWEQAGLLDCLITQNIDGLHQQAGSRNVLELHGTARQIACLDCGARFPADDLVAQFLVVDAVPPCPDCGGMIKHATISFGQSLDAGVLQAASNAANEAQLFLAIGSSLVVEPAASLPRMAKRNGSRLVIVNRDPTPLDELADHRIGGSIGDVLAEIDELRRGLG